MKNASKIIIILSCLWWSGISMASFSASCLGAQSLEVESCEASSTSLHGSAPSFLDVYEGPTDGFSIRFLWEKIKYDLANDPRRGERPWWALFGIPAFLLLAFIAYFEPEPKDPWKEFDRKMAEKAALKKSNEELQIQYFLDMIQRGFYQELDLPGAPKITDDPHIEECAPPEMPENIRRKFEMGEVEIPSRRKKFVYQEKPHPEGDKSVS